VGQGRRAADAARPANLQLTERAVRDLARLKAFVAEHDPTATERIADKLLESLHTLTEQPFAGRSL